MNYLDISVSGFTSGFSRKAHHFNVDTQILLKVPAENLTSIRLKGNRDDILEFLTSLLGSPFVHRWTKETIQMHASVIKKLTADNEAPHHKNRLISERRQKSI